MPRRTSAMLRSRVCATMLVAAAASVWSGCDGTFSGTFSFDGDLFSFQFRFPETSTDTSTVSVPVDGVTTLKVVTRNGSIRVGVDSSRTDARVRVFKFANSSSQAAASELLENIAVDIKRSGDNDEILEIAVTLPNPDGTTSRSFEFGGNGRTGVSFNITLPTGLILDLATDNGPITVVGNTGPAKVRTTNGGIVVDGNAGDCDLATTNGAIIADRVNGNLLARATNGAIEAHVTPPAETPMVDLSTSNGSIRLEVPINVKAGLDLRSSAGLVSADLTGFAVTGLSRTRSRVTATLNGGGGTIKAATTAGFVDFEGL